MSLITDEARAWIGRELDRFQVPIRQWDILKLAQATDEPETYLKGDGAGEPMLAPATIFGALNNHPDPSRSWAPDGISAEQRPPLASTRTMAGGTELEIRRLPRDGEVIEVRKTVADMYEKEGRSGPLAFVVYEQTYSTLDGGLVARERRTSIMR